MSWRRSAGCGRSDVGRTSTRSPSIRSRLMRNSSPWLLLALLSACASARSGPEPRSAELAIIHATVVDVESGRTLPDHTVLMSGDRIVRVGPAADATTPAGAQVIDAAGKFVIPGLTDAHVHLSFTGADALPLFVAHGVTSVRDLGSRLDDIAAMRERIRSRELIGPRITTSGP